MRLGDILRAPRMQVDGMQKAEVVIIGSGIIGASVAYSLTARGLSDIMVLEKEDLPNRHSSGRNASYYLPMYDTDVFSSLGQASFPFFICPPDSFSDGPLFASRGAVIAATEIDEHELEQQIETARTLGIAVEMLTPSEAGELVPIVRTDWIRSAAYYPYAGPIDVHALSTGYIRAAKRRGATFKMNEEVVAIRTNGGRVVAVETRNDVVACSTIVNAAGAWAGMVGKLAGAIDIEFIPRRRHIISVKLDSEATEKNRTFFRCPSLPLYLKPERGRLLASRMDQDPDQPGDCMTDDMRVAEVADSLNIHTKVPVRHIERSWAGHRTFAADDAPVIGTDPHVRGFVWAAGLGGAGVMGAPEVGELVADAVMGLRARAMAEVMWPERFL